MTICYPGTTDWGCVPEVELDEMDPVVQARSEAMAWSALHSLTAGNIAICPSVVRPCSIGCASRTWYASTVGGIDGTAFRPSIDGGIWTNSCGCRTATSCSCTTIREIVLPGLVGGIVSIQLAGATLDPTAYRVDNGNRLVRQDGELWPACQDMNVPADHEDAFVVTYWNGAAPDESINYAAGLLALEFYKACTGGACKLPTGVTRVARQGISYEIANGLFVSGYTGIQAVDMVIRMHNPLGHKTRPAILSPDVPGGRTRTWSRV